MVYFYSILTSIFFGGLFYYLINYVLMPYDTDNNLNISSFAIVTVVFLALVASLFTFFHLILDKLFFRKFYEGPKIFMAVRRGILLGIMLSGLAWVRVFGYWEWHITLVIVALVILFELLFLSISIGQEGGDSVKKGQDSNKFESNEASEKRQG